MRHLGIYIAAAALAVSTLGCGSAGPEMYPVRGEVTYNGKPLGVGRVVYIPSAPGGRQAMGSINPDGSFVLTSQTKDDGAAKGSYYVVVYARNQDFSEPTSREEIEAAGQRGTPKSQYIIPEKYVDPVKSGLTDTVDENHSGFKKLELTG